MQVADRRGSTKPVVQVALDVASVEEAIALGEMAVGAGADWIEIGKPLMDFVGLRGLGAVTRCFEGTYILLDSMIMAGPGKYVDMAASLGVSNITVTALSPAATVSETIGLGKKAGLQVTVDLFNVRAPVEDCQMYEDMGADYIMVHFGVDQKRRDPEGSPLMTLREVVSRVKIPVSYATYDLAESLSAVECGASVIVQGEPILHAPDAASALKEFIEATKVAGRQVA
jgi:3-keto-L-gulonate-6-phosphate decarboxylase